MDIHDAVLQTPGIRLVGDAVSPKQGLGIVSRYRPDLILADADNGGEAAAELVRALRQSSPESRIILLGEGPEYRQLVELGRLGVWGYVLWPSVNAQRIQAAMTAVLAGLRVGSSEVASELVAPPWRRYGAGGGVPVLTDLDRAVLQGLVAGLPRAEIAAVEHVSVRTVARTITRLCERLDVPNVRALVARAVEMGLGEDDPVA